MGVDIGCLPDELLAQLFHWVDSQTLLASVNGVCRRWRVALAHTPRLHLDLTFLRRHARMRALSGTDEGTALLVALLTRFRHVAAFTSNFWRITNADVAAVAQRCPRLLSMTLRYPPLIVPRFEREMKLLTGDFVLALAKFCPLLQKIFVSGCPAMNDAAIAALAEQCPHLTSVHFEHPGVGSNVTDAAIVAVAKHCPGLVSIRCPCWYLLTATAVTALVEGCPGLADVDLTHCNNISTASLVQLALGTPLLRSIKLNYCRQLTTGGLSTLVKQRPGLVLVDFGKTKVSDGCIRSLAVHSPTLTSLSLASTNLTDRAIAAIGKSCPDLETVDVSRNRKITAAALAALARRCRKLTTVVLQSDCGFRGDAFVAALAEYSAGLTVLNLSGVQLTDASLVALGQGCCRLAEVLLHGLTLTDASFVGLAAGCPDLEAITCTQATHVSDRSLEALGAGCPALTAVTFTDAAITNAGVLALAQHRPGLLAVCFDYCHDLSPKAVITLAKHCPEMTKISFDLCWIRRVHPAVATLWVDRLVVRFPRFADVNGVERLK
jgi:hypothetical protein